MLTLIENGEVYAPQSRGRQSVLLVDGKVGKVGRVDRRPVEALGLDCEFIDAAGCLIVPGLIDPHQHLLGGSGEEGFSTQTPEITLSEIVSCGITTVVGCLGVDTTMKTMPGLLARVKALEEEGIGAYLWTGGYNVPPTTIMKSVREDLMFIDEVVGAGEIAISDARGMDPDPREIAKVATDAFVGGKLARKAGLTHFHVGDADTRLEPVRTLLEAFHVEPEWCYLTHIERGKQLMREAIALARRGAAVDIDVVEGDLVTWLRYYLDNGGDPERLTISSDAALSSPRALYEQLCRCVRELAMPLEEVLPFATSNTARILKLEQRGSLEPGKAGDLLILDRDTLDIRDVLASGKRMVKDGELAVSEGFLDDSDRSVILIGKKGLGD
jgi:beta-aspartyl-dipeptidase (metallo-type)